MKFKAIASAYKADKRLVVINDPNGKQWISNGAAIYSLEGMPVMNPMSILAVFDIPEEKREEWTTREEDMNDEVAYLCENNQLFDENALEMMTAEVKWNGRTCVFLKHNNEIYSINEKYLKPLYDSLEYLRFFVKKTRDEKLSVVMCYYGLELKAIILPAKFNDKAIEELYDIASNLVYVAVAESNEQETENDYEG